MGPRDRYGGSEFGVGADLNRKGVNAAADEENRRGRFPTPVITPGGKPKRAKESTDRGDQVPSLIPSVGRHIGILLFGIFTTVFEATAGKPCEQERARPG